MKHLFIVSSAINTKFGEFDSDQRLLQTYQTLKSVYDRVPDARVAIIESSGIPLDEATVQGLHNVVHCLIDMSKNETVKKIHDSTPNWDIVKNVCEILCFSLSFQMLEENGQLEGVDRIHKLSGRYTLNDNFNPLVYETYPDKIILTGKRETIFGDKVGIPYQYASRLWSWPIERHTDVKSFYTDAMIELRERIPAGKYADIEHLLYKLLPSEHIQTVPVIGVEGLIGGTRKFISD